MRVVDGAPSTGVTVKAQRKGRDEGNPVYGLEVARVSVRVTPRADREGVAWRPGAGEIAVRVTAAPADGAANAAVVRLLARALRVPSRDVVLVTGARSRVKQFDLPLDAEEIVRRLEGATT